MRLFPNPNFDDEAAQQWDPERFMTDESYYKDKDLVRVLDKDTKVLIAKESERPFSFSGFLKGMFYLSPLGYVWDYESYRKAWVVAKVAQEQSE